MTFHEGSGPDPKKPSFPDVPFYRDFRYTDLIKTELERFRRTPAPVQKFIGDKVVLSIIQHEVEKFAKSHKISTDDVRIEAKGSPFFDDDDGPGIMLTAKVYPHEEQVDAFAKQSIISLRDRVMNLKEFQKQLDKIPEKTRNLLEELTYIE